MSLLEKVNELCKKYPNRVFAGFHTNYGRQVLLWEYDNVVCQQIGTDDYIGNLYLEDKKGNLNVVWTYKNGWLKEIGK
jgi:hypothetical protein